MFGTNLTRNRILLLLGLVLGVTVVVLAAVGASYVSRLSDSLPPVDRLIAYEPAIPSVVLSRDGVKIGEIFTEKRYPLELGKMSKQLVDAFVSAEDARFFQHKGIDYHGLIRAGFHYLGRSSARQGGSTITQQLAKTLLLSRERTIERKLKDIILAKRIEQTMPKEKILELYLNTIFLGNNSYGVEAASRNYFRKTNIDLTLAEAAMIAGLAPAPSAYAPTENLQKAKARQKFVLEQMVKNKKISLAQANEAFAQPLRVHRAESPNTQAAPYFLMEVKKQLEKMIPEEKLSTQGYTVRTTIDMQLQKATQESVTRSLKAYSNKKNFKGPIKRHGQDYMSSLTALLNTPVVDEEEARAIVVDSYPKLAAYAIVSQGGLGLLLAEDHKWTVASPGDDSGLQPSDFLSVLKVGDEVHVKDLQRGTPKRIEKANSTFQKLGKFVPLYPAGTSHTGIRFYGLSDTEGVEAAALLMNPHTGEVLAMVGGEGFGNSQFNRATQARRQVGSSVKPLYYAMAQDRGFSPISLLDSPPIVIGDWRPENYGKEFNGRTTLRRALINSHNIPSIQLAQALGLRECVKQFVRLGLDWSEEDLGFSIALGSGSATLLQMVQAYSPFANSGRIAEAFYITRIEDRKGQVVALGGQGHRELMADAVGTPPTPNQGKSAADQKNKGKNKLAARNIEEPSSDLPAFQWNPAEPLQVLSPAAAYVTVRIMQDVIRFGTGTQAAGASPHLAGKTGTTNNYTDAWFLGVTPALVGGVWVGFDDASKSLGSGATGGRMAAPIWGEIMIDAVKRYPSAKGWSEPEGIVTVNADLDSGKPSRGGVPVPVVLGSEPGAPTARNALGVLGLEGEGAGTDHADPDEGTSALRGSY